MTTESKGASSGHQGDGDHAVDVIAAEFAKTLDCVDGGGIVETVPGAHVMSDDLPDSTSSAHS